MKKLLPLIITIFSVFQIVAQQYPVTIVPRVNAPAPVNFYNYADETSLNSPITLQIFLNDITVASRQVRLKTYFEGGNISFRSKDFVIGAEELFLEGGVPLTLRNIELAPYFKFENIEGINATTYGQTIPEGSYNFCFEIYDYLSGTKLSTKKCATVFIFKNEPPILNLPFNTTNIEPKDFETIVFQWTPRHLNVSNVEYEFSLVEIWDDYVNPQTAFLSQVPIYEETTRRTTLVYGPDKPLLLEGKRYAWRVRAKALLGVEEIGLFKNQGYSEVFWFSRTAPCEAPGGVSGEAAGTSKINIFWNQDPNVHSEFIIAYREAGKTNAHWFTKRTNSAWATIWDLKPGTTYEFKVKGKCQFQYSEYSPVQTVTTEIAPNTDANYQCGIVPDAIAIDNRQPHPGLNLGDVITAGDFRITITELQSQSAGIISGKGYVAIPYLKFAKFGVTFSNILVNNANQLAQGEIVTLYDPELGKGSSMVVDVDIDIPDAINGDDGVLDDAVVVNFEIDSVVIDANGAIVVTGTNGETATIPGDEDVNIVSTNGDVWSVGEDGTITKQEGAEGGAVVDTNTGGVDENGAVTAVTAKGVKVIFKNSGYYYFDALPQGTSETFEKEYKTITGTSGEYRVPYKAISDTNGEDFVEAEVIITDTDIKKEDIIFKTKDGAKVSVEWTGTTAKLKLKRKFDFGDEEILAVVKSKDNPEKFDIAGSLITKHLASQQLEEINVTLVPVGISGVSDEVKQQVKEIYKKAGVRLNIQETPSVQIDEIYGWDVDNDGQIKVGDSSILTHYTNEEAVFNKYVKKQNYYSKTAYYVFITNLPVSKSEVSGFMPLNGQFGFVFTRNANTSTKQARTLAHELGHGIFGLKHTWEQYKFPQGATNFLMDYGNGTVLNHLDWKEMHGPGMKLYWFQGDEEGEAIGDDLNPIYTHIRNKLESFSSSLNSKMISIVHCENCNEEDSLENKEIQYLELDENEISILNDKRFEVFNTIDLKLRSVEKIKVGDRACFSLYYSVDENIDIISTKLEQFDNSNLKPDLIKKQLVVFDHDNNKQYECTNQLGSWSNVICNTGWTVNENYINNLFDHLNRCSEMNDSQYARIHNYSSEQFENAEFINELLSGNKVIIDPYTGETRHSSKAHLFITEGLTLTEEVGIEIENYHLDEGEYKIWLHKNVEGLWEVKSYVPENVLSMFNEVDNEIENTQLQSSIDDDFSFNDFFKGLQQGVSDVGGVLDTVATGLYEAFDWLGKGVRKARIPTYAWNCNDANYKSEYAKVYKYFSKVINPIQNLINTNLLPRMANQVNDPAIKQCILDFNEGEVEFALLCGLYNGLIEVVASIPDLLKFAAGAASSKGREDFSKFLDQLERFKKEDTQGNLVCEGTWCAIKTGLGDAFSPSKCCQFAELVGEIALPIIVAVFGDVVALEGVASTSAQTFIKVIQILKWIDNFADPFTKLKWTFRYVNSGLSYIRNASNKIIVKISNEGYKLHVILEDGIRTITKNLDEVPELVTNNGITYMNNIADATGGRARVLEFDLGDALKSKGIEYSKLYNLVKNLDDEVASRILNRLNKTGLTDIDLNEFIEDLTSNTEFFNHFKSIDIMGTYVNDFANGWKLIIKRAQMRKDISIVEASAKLIKDNPDYIQNNLSKIEQVFEKLAASGARCKTCPSSGNNAGIKHFDEILEDINFAISRYKDKSGFDKLITEMTAHKHKADGGAFMLQVLKSKGDDFVNKVQEFESFYLSGTRFEADIKLVDNGKVILQEFKSYAKDSWNSLGINQLKGYLKSTEYFEYIGNRTKLINDGVPNPSQFVKEKLQTIFKKDNYNIYNEIIQESPDAFKRFGINTKGQFIQKVNNLDDDLFGFIKVE